MVAAAALACITGKKAAGIHDHSSGQALAIAAECRGDQLRGFDGDRGVKSGGTLPDLHDAGDGTIVSLKVDGTKATGFDRVTSSYYEARVTGGLVQVFDHGQDAWFAYDIQDGQAPRGYHRSAAGGIWRSAADRWLLISGAFIRPAWDVSAYTQRLFQVFAVTTGGA